MTDSYLPLHAPMQPEESLLGYVLRRAAMNVDPRGVYGALSWLQIDYVWGQLINLGKDLETLARRLEISVDTARQGALEPNGKELRVYGKHVLQRRFTCPDAPRLCPLCIRERAIIRREWELAYVTECPIHAIPLINTCPSCGEPISWGRLELDRCPTCQGRYGHDSAASHAGAWGIGCLLTGVATGADHLIPAWAKPFAAGGLSDCIDAVIFAAKTALRQGNDRDAYRRSNLSDCRRTTESASALLNEHWPQGFLHAVDATESNAVTKLKDRFPGIYGPLYLGRQKPGLAAFRQAFEQHIKSTHPTARISGKSKISHVASDYITITAAARELGTSTRVLRRLLADAHIPLVRLQHGSGGERLLRTDLLRLAECRWLLPGRLPAFPSADLSEWAGGNVPASWLRRRLSVSDAVLAHFPSHPAFGLMRNRDGLTLAWTHWRAVERALAERAAASSLIAGNDRLSLEQAVKDKLRRFGISAATVLAALVNGEVTSLNVQDGEGLGRLVISKAEITSYAEYFRRRREESGFLGTPEVADMLMTTPDNISKLVQAGYLTDMQEKRSRTAPLRFQRSEVEAFRRRYITADEIVARLGWKRGPASSTRIARWLMGQGIRAALSPAASGMVVSFYERRAAEQILTGKAAHMG